MKEKIDSNKKKRMSVITLLLVFSMIFPISFVSAREAESGGGSNSGSGSSGSSGSVSSPRPDDNPSVSDLLEGKRILVPENSNGISGFDSERDLLERNLGFGLLRDDDVSKLQQELKDLGFFNNLVTGNFMEMTRQAVMEFQRAHGIEATGFVGVRTRAELNNQHRQRNRFSGSENSGTGSVGANRANIEKQIQNLMELVRRLQEQLSRSIGSTSTPPQSNVTSTMVTAEAQRKAGIIITGGVSGPGYPTGPLNLVIPMTQLLLDRPGTVKQGVGQLDISDRQYEAPLETIPPTMGSFPITINGVSNIATQLKVISSLRTKNGVGQHQGTIDVDIDTVPAGHLTLQYNGTATVNGSMITSKGNFKTSKVTGIFTGLVAEGTYDMTISEMGTSVGSPVIVNVTTVSP